MDIRANLPTESYRSIGALWSSKNVDLVLLVCVLVRLIIVSLLIVGFPPLQSHDGFYFHHGGDQDYYFEYGRVLSIGSFERYFAVNLGQPAIMAISIWLFSSDTFSEILPILVLVNGYLFGGLSVILVGRLAYRLAGSFRAAWLAAALWAVMPWVIWLVSLVHPSRTWLQAPYVPGVAWLQGIPDGPAVFFALMGLYFLVTWLDTDQPALLVASGVALGVMMLFRFQMVSILLLALLVIVIERRTISCIGLAVSAIVAYLPQVIYNHISSTLAGVSSIIAWLPGYLYSGLVDPLSNEIYWRNPEFNFLHFMPGHTNSPLLATTALWILGIGVLLVLVVVGVIARGSCMGRGRSFISYAAPWASIGAPMLSPIFLENVYRFSLPATPFLALLGGLWCDAIWSAVHRYRTKESL